MAAAAEHRPLPIEFKRLPPEAAIGRSAAHDRRRAARPELVRLDHIELSV